MQSWNCDSFTMENLITKPHIFAQFHTTVVAVTHATFCAKNYFNIDKSINDNAEWLTRIISDKLVEILQKFFKIIVDTLPFAHSARRERVNSLGDLASQTVLALHLL